MTTTDTLAPAIPALESDFLFLIYDTAQLMRRRADSRAREVGMTRAQWAVLARLERQPGISQNALAQLTDVEPITVGRLIDRLEASGHVERQPDPNDRRVWRLRLTAKATGLLTEIHQFRRELHDQVVEGLDAKTHQALICGLQRIRTNLSAAKELRAGKKDTSQ
jgi:MarR family transcriptional regulator for hemolysin